MLCIRGFNYQALIRDMLVFQQSLTRSLPNLCFLNIFAIVHHLLNLCIFSSIIFMFIFIYVTCCLLPTLLRYLNFILCSPRLVRLRGYEPVRFPATHLPPFIPTPGGRDDV